MAEIYTPTKRKTKFLPLQQGVSQKESCSVRLENRQSKQKKKTPGEMAPKIL